MQTWTDPGPVYPREAGWGASGSPARFDVEVTRAHIEAGRIGVPGACPIALACRAARRLGQRPDEPNPMLDARVSGGLIHWTRKGRHIAVVVPLRVLRWLHDYDDGKPVSPFAFSLYCYSAAET